MVGARANSASSYRRLLGDVQLDPAQAPNYITSTPMIRGSRIGASLWATGADICGQIHHTQPADEHITSPKGCAKEITRACSDTVWEDTDWIINVGWPPPMRISEHVRLSLKSRGCFITEWLRLAALPTSHWLHDLDGLPYQFHGQGIFRDAAVLKDLVSWTWVGLGKITFLVEINGGAASKPTRRKLQSLCAALTYNFPSSSISVPPKRQWSRMTLSDCSHKRGGLNVTAAWSTTTPLSRYHLYLSSPCERWKLP